MASKIEEKVENLIKPVVENLGYELAEVDYSKKHDGMNLTVFLYSEKGISVSDCEKVHKSIDGMLDELDPTNGAPYRLNVSSLGLDRPIKTPADFKRNINKEVVVRFYFPFNGNKELSGVLTAFSDKGFDLKINNEIIKIDIEKAAKIELKLDF